MNFGTRIFIDGIEVWFAMNLRFNLKINMQTFDYFCWFYVKEHLNLWGI